MILLSVIPEMRMIRIERIEDIPMFNADVGLSQVLAGP